jgi:hypothetical protein
MNPNMGGFHEVQGLLIYFTVSAIIITTGNNCGTGRYSKDKN